MNYFFLVHKLVIKRTGCVETVSRVPFHFSEVFIEAVEGLWQVVMFLSSAKTSDYVSNEFLPTFVGKVPIIGT